LNTPENYIPVLGEEPVFPPVEYANEDGLLAMGGDLSPRRLINAYRQGIFPWFNDDALPLWWSPDPRLVLFPGELKVSKSMRRVLNSGRFRCTRNQAFKQVIQNCADIPRKGHTGTWITPGMQHAYLKLFGMGIAHSFETWQGNELVGGIYGLDLGHVFCGESMYHTVSNASKYALIQLVNHLEERKYRLLDCQVSSPHLLSLGARQIPRGRFLEILKAGGNP